RQYVGVANTPLYEFGYGLSYTSFSINNLAISKSVISAGENLTASVELANTGSETGDEVVQLYIHYPSGGITRAVKELKAFSRETLKPGGKKQVSFTIAPNLLACYNAKMEKEVLKGTYTIMVGNSSRDSDLKSINFTVK
ncbi:beta-glucosidase, partial [bacterium]